MSARILVVEDNPVSLRLAAGVLELAGYDVERATDAPTALSAIARSTPDLILTDIGLPGMDGLALTRVLKADARVRHVPVVALTAFAMRGDEARASEAGCDGYITKPIDTRRLPGQIADFLRRAAPPEGGAPG